MVIDLKLNRDTLRLNCCQMKSNWIRLSAHLLVMQGSQIDLLLVFFSLKASHLCTIVRIFGDPQMVPQIISEVIYPRSTSVLVEPCGSQNLACGSYVKLQYVRSSSAFPAIGQFVVDNETSTNTMTTMITGAGSMAANGTTISERARARRRTRERILIFGNYLANLCLAGSHFSLFLVPVF